MTYWLINQINRFVNNQGVIIIVIMIYYFRYFTHFRRSNCMETQLFCSLFGLITDQKNLKPFYCSSPVIHLKIRKSNLFLQHPTFYRRHEYRVWYDIRVDFPSRDKNLHIIWKLQFCNKSHSFYPVIKTFCAYYMGV